MTETDDHDTAATPSWFMHVIQAFYLGDVMFNTSRLLKKHAEGCFPPAYSECKLIHN